MMALHVKTDTRTSLSSVWVRAAAKPQNTQKRRNIHYQTFITVVCWSGVKARWSACVHDIHESRCTPLVHVQATKWKSGVLSKLVNNILGARKELLYWGHFKVKWWNHVWFVETYHFAVRCQFCSSAMKMFFFALTIFFFSNGFAPRLSFVHNLHWQYMPSFTLLWQNFVAQALIFALPLLAVTHWGNRGAERLWQVVNPLG